MRNTAPPSERRYAVRRPDGRWLGSPWALERGGQPMPVHEWTSEPAHVHVFTSRGEAKRHMRSIGEATRGLSFVPCPPQGLAA